MGKTNMLKAFAGFLLLLIISLFPLYPIVSQAADDSVCAEVKIEIKQELTLERQAFDADIIFYGYRHTGQRGDNFAGPVLLIDKCRLLRGVLFIYRDKSIEAGV